MPGEGGETGLLCQALTKDIWQSKRLHCVEVNGLLCQKGICKVNWSILLT